MTQWPTLKLRPTERGGESGSNGDGPRLRPREVVAGAGGVGRAVRRLARPVPLAGIVLVLVAAVGYWSVYSATTSRTLVLVPTRDLPAGATLRVADVRTAELAGDGAVLDRVVPEGQLGSIVGRRLATGVAAGVPLPTAALAAPTRTNSAFTLAVPVVRAVAGAIQPGDRVTVLATFDAGGGGAETRVIARNLQVQAVGAEGGALGKADDTLPVTVALPDPSSAAELALANDSATISLLLDGQRGATDPIPPAGGADGR